jgi:epoxyqueuosine reductase
LPGVEETPLKEMALRRNTDHRRRDIAAIIVERAKALGASLAGIADLSSVKETLSRDIYGGIAFPEGAGSVLVLALAHRENEPELDWWDDGRGGSPGNRLLIGIAENAAQWMRDEYGIGTQPLPYSVEEGGIFLKESAALAGLGTIGENNLLITREWGPRIRLRALFLRAELAPTAPMDFSPCEGCDMPCRRACPQDAFMHGSYSREICSRQMSIDAENRLILKRPVKGLHIRIKYCRACELACPVGR